MLAVEQAVSLSTIVGGNQQLADMQAATQAAQTEQQVNNTEETDVQAAATYVNIYAQLVAKNPNDKTLQAELTEAQTQFQNVQTQQQTYTQQADSGTQAAQNQTTQDSTNMQQKVTLESAINQMMQSLAAAMAQHY